VRPKLYDIVSETAGIYGMTAEDVMVYRRSMLTLIARDHCIYEVWMALGQEPTAVAQFFKRVSSQAITRAVERHINRVTEAENEFD
jgi:hypothetical protein